MIAGRMDEINAEEMEQYKKDQERRRMEDGLCVECGQYNDTGRCLCEDCQIAITVENTTPIDEKTQLEPTSLIGIASAALDDRYNCYRLNADNGEGIDITTGEPLKTFDEWLNS
jgi:hypothetical protein